MGSPTMYLTKISMENDNFQEDATLPRIVGSSEEMQHVCDYENKNIETLNDKISVIVTPTGILVNNKRNLSYFD